MKLEKIKKQLPHGALGKIAELSKVSYITVINFFNGKKTKSDIIIMEAIISFLKEYEEKKAKLIQDLQNIENEENRVY